MTKTGVFVSKAASKEPIIIYTDGACLGNPGPAGLGVVLRCGSHRKELMEQLGYATNNIAELTAIQRALEAVKDRFRPVRIHSDSEYAIGVLSRGWKAKANRELIGEIRKLMTLFPDLELIKVPGHAGVPDNERCDELARTAAEKSRSRGI